jgi:formylglycine-generating enzyme required for sulfatase activity
MKSLLTKLLSIGILIQIFPLSQLSAQKLPKEIRKQFAAIPAGKIKTETQEIETSDFYIAKAEVSCLSYKKFSAEIKKKGDGVMLQKIQIDTNVWDLKEYRATYGIHPAFDNYPVVGISKYAAEEYCRWLTDKYGQGLWEFRLPTRIEWMRATQGTHASVPYPWGKTKWEGYRLQNQKGIYQCNFADWYGTENLKYSDSFKEVTINGKSFNRDNFDYIAYSDFYPKNDFGLFNMNGNVAEIISDEEMAVGGSWKSGGYDVRVESTKPYTKPTDDIGFRPVAVLRKRN